MKSIYITALHLQHGGVEMAISLLANAFVRRGYDVNILSVYNLGEPAYKLDKRIKVSYLTEVIPNREAFLKAKEEKKFIRMMQEGIKAIKILYLKYKSMRKAITSIKEGVIISTRNEHSILLSKYGQDNVLKIAQLHHDHNFKKKYIKDFREKYTKIDYFVLLTEQLKEEIETFIKEKNTDMKCVVIPNFLDVNEFSEKNFEKEKTVIAIGRLHPVKGFDRMLRIWEKISKKHPEWQLKILGGGEEEEKLKMLVKELHIEKSVNMMGMCNHDIVIEELEKASLYMMTSYSEAFPFVLIEAMMAEVPVVAFDVRVGPKAIIQDGENGYLIEDKEEEKFIETMEYIMSHEKERVIMRKKCVKKAEELCEDVVMEKWVSLIENSRKMK
jgi:glycosyltransferase involved in cell wall biosynthesis